ncbi:hypothetical protein SCODD09_01380 [Streptococcus constellatus]|nr:hypothetical protein SCODD09_01380 [Streptococcus constellatus]
MIDLYEQAEKANNWTRFEVEYKDKKAHVLTQEILKCHSDTELKNLILSAMLSDYMFFHTKSNRPHKITKLMLELLEEQNFQFPSKNQEDISLERSITYIFENSGLLPILYKINQIWDIHAVDNFLDFLKSYLSNEFSPNIDHRTWLAQHTNNYKNKPYPWEKYRPKPNRTALKTKNPNANKE